MLKKWCYSRLSPFLGKLWKQRCLCKGRIIEAKAAILFWLLFSMFGVVGFFKNFYFWSIFRVDFFIPGVSVVGGFSICSSPGLLEREGILELAVKHTVHPPAHWIHTEVNEIICWLWDLEFCSFFFFLGGGRGWYLWFLDHFFAIDCKTPVDLFIFNTTYILKSFIHYRTEIGCLCGNMFIVIFWLHLCLVDLQWYCS